MLWLAAIIVCADLEHCELRYPSGADLLWPTLEACLEHTVVMGDGARQQLGNGVEHVSGWCIPVPAENRASQGDSQGPERS